MAANAREYRYTNRDFMTSGNLARDLDWAVRERELNHAGEAVRPRREERPVTKVRSKEQAQVLVRERQSVSVVTLLGFAAVAAAAVLVLMSYIQLTALSADTVALKSQLNALEAEQVVLAAQHERMFDMSTVKAAASAAGMSKPGSSQICYLDLASEDSAIVYQMEEGSRFSKLLSSLHHGVYTVVEYFD